ncbi:hypothetical protein EDD28_0091 [Salana multivorans]|uniref:Uncharacterized protein n=1 Tax=Salana multivorans TaxID=120377 RepID=A0A3N2D714_9MICO|nr:hypothetical protein [Salana multivorans]ROR95452.1 hypothetical protein EDD28_0004 [Salana multivorans]ROR95535.1 hypothetical protein EDD28_0091 [Salana multivorans]
MYQRFKTWADQTPWPLRVAVMFTLVMGTVMLGTTYGWAAALAALGMALIVIGASAAIDRLKTVAELDRYEGWTLIHPVEPVKPSVVASTAGGAA